MKFRVSPCRLEKLFSRTFPRLEELETRLAPATLVDPMTVTYQDADGDAVTVRASLPVFVPDTVNLVFTFHQGSVDGDNSRPQQLQRFDLTPLDPAAVSGVSLTLTTAVPATGDGLVHVGYVRATDLDLGAVSVNRDVGRLDAGDTTLSTAGLVSLRVHSLGRFGTSTQPPGGNLSTNIQGELRILHVDTDIVGASVRVTGGPQGRMGSVTILGSILGNSTSRFGLVSSTGEMGFVVIGGILEGQVNSGGYLWGALVGRFAAGGDAGESGAIQSSGGMGPVQIGGDPRGGTGADSGRIRTGGPPGPVVVNGSLLGSGPGSATIFSADNMGQVLITGDVRGGTGPASGRIVTSVGAIAGVTIGGSLIGTERDTAVISSGGNLGPVDITGAVRGGTGDGSGYIYSARYISRVSVGTTVLGGDGGASGQIRSQGGVGPVSIGGDLRAGFGGESGRIRSHGDIGDVTIHGSLVGFGPNSGSLLADGSIGLVYITGDVRGGTTDTAARILASTGGIASVIIGGALVGGAASTGLIFCQRDLPLLFIGGDVQGGAGANSGSVSVGGAINVIWILGSLLGGAGNDSGTIRAAQIGPVQVEGYFGGGAGLNAGSLRTTGGLTSIRVGSSLFGGTRDGTGVILSGGDVGSVTIEGDIWGGSVTGTASLDSSGYIQGRRIERVRILGSIFAGTNSGTGHLTRSGSIRADNDIAELRVDGHLIGGPTTPVILSTRGQASPVGTSDVALGSLRIGGLTWFANVLAGYNVNGIGVNADAQVGTLHAGEHWLASNLAAGVTAGPDGFFGTDDDAKLRGPGVRDNPKVLSAINDVVIDGVVWGSGSGTDHHGLVAEWVRALAVSGIAVPLFDGPHNDHLPLTLEEDVTVHEVPSGRSLPRGGLACPPLDPEGKPPIRVHEAAALGSWDWVRQVQEQEVALVEFFRPAKARKGA